MSSLPAEPSFKDKISASWMRDLLRYVRSLTPVAGPGMKVSRGPNGTVYSSKQVKPASEATPDPLHPWKVFAVGKSEDVDHFFEIYIPDGSITVGAKEVEIDGIEETETPKRFTFACETDVGESSTLYLVVRKEEDEDKEIKYTSILAVDLSEYEDDESVTDVIPIAELAVVEGEEYDKGKVVSQMQKDAIRIYAFEVPVDDVSIGRVTSEDAKDPETIQIKNFDNDESDGGQGLTQRLKVVKKGEESFTIETDGASKGVFLIARVNGKIKYIPLDGATGKDPDEEQPENPCDHPGDQPGTGGEGGVSPDDEEEHGGGGVAAGGGGVPADDDSHAGDPCPDCSPTK